MPKTEIHRCSLNGGLCLGVIRYQGKEIPILDTRAAFGLGANLAPVQSAAVVLRFPLGGTLAFTLDAVRDIPRLSAEAIKPLPLVARAATGRLRGMIKIANGSLALIFDEEAIRGDAYLSSLSRLCRPKKAEARLAQAKSPSVAEGRATDERSITPDVRPYLLYVAGEVQATPLVEVSEILPYPDCVTAIDGRSDGLIGLFYHHSAVVPRIHLAAHLGFRADIDRDKSRVLLIEHQGTCIGFLIDSLQSIEPGHWRSNNSQAGLRTTYGSAGVQGEDAARLASGSARRDRRLFKSRSASDPAPQGVLTGG